jgi:hypothetical protein
MLTPHSQTIFKTHNFETLQVLRIDFIVRVNVSECEVAKPASLHMEKGSSSVTSGKYPSKVPLLKFTGPLRTTLYFCISIVGTICQELHLRKYMVNKLYHCSAFWLHV